MLTVRQLVWQATIRPLDSPFPGSLYSALMLTTKALKFFGGYGKLAAALDIRAPSIHGWGTTVPPLRQLQIEHITGGKLKANRAILPAHLPPRYGKSR